MNENHLIQCPARSGYNPIFNVGEHGMELTGFGLLMLNAGESYTLDTAGNECALVLLGGKCSVKGADFDFPAVGRRRNVFDGAPHTVYLPWKTRCVITALDGACDIAVNLSPASRDTAKPTVISPEDTRTFPIGKDNFTRYATVMIDEKFDSEHFYIGEGMIPSGNWSGWPPHRHDEDNLPDEVDMEETYFYRFEPECGFGIQKVYTQDVRVDRTYTVKNNDTVAIPEGFHPLCGAPGYQMYYLWTMAGRNNRGLISFKDPVHNRV